MTATAPAEAKGPAAESIIAIAAKALGMEPSTATEQSVRNKMAEIDSRTKAQEPTKPEEWIEYEKMVGKVFVKKSDAKSKLRTRVVHLFPQYPYNERGGAVVESEAFARFLIETYEPKERRNGSEIEILRENPEQKYINAKEFSADYRRSEED